jgi:hypothetical protein
MQKVQGVKVAVEPDPNGKPADPEKTQELPAPAAPKAKGKGKKSTGDTDVI